MKKTVLKKRDLILIGVFGIASLIVIAGVFFPSIGSLIGIVG